MALSLQPILGRIHELAGAAHDGPSDAELLKRIARDQDPAAFGLVLQRHGGLVWRVCRRVLDRRDGAEDAFQSTFLVLLRRAGAIRKSAALASWLHGVAFRIALRAKKREAREQAPALAASPRQDPGFQAACRELGRILEEEVANLPERLRLPVLLCYWEGKTNEEAARRLGWPTGTVKTRLAKAREVLQRRLTRRGVTLPAGAITMLLTPAATEATPALLVAATAKLIHGCGAASSATVLALAESAMPATMLMKLKPAVLLVVAFLALAGVGVLTSSPLSSPPAQPADIKPPPAVQVKDSEKQQMHNEAERLPPGAIARLGTLRFRHDGYARSVAFSPDGTTLAAATRSGVIFWDAASGKEVWRIKDIRGDLDFSPDGKTVAIQHFLGLSLWDISGRKQIKNLKLEDLVPDGRPKGNGVRFSPDGKNLAFLCGGKAAVLDLESDKIRAEVGIGSAVIEDVAFSPDGATLAIATFNPSVQLWDIATGKMVRGIDDHGKTFAGALAFSRDGRMLASGSWDRIILSDPKTGKLLGRLEAKMQSINDLAFTPDGKSLLSRSQDAVIRIWDVATGKVRSTLDRTDGWYGMALSRDGKIVAGGDGSSIRVWDVASGKDLSAEHSGHSSDIRALVFSPDGKSLFSASWHAPIRQWDTTTWKQTQLFDGGAQTLALSRDGKRLISTPSNTFSRIWQVASAREISRINSIGSGYLRHGFFFPDGSRFVTYQGEGQSSESYVNQLRVWDPATGKQLSLFEWRNFFLFSIVPTSDGKVIGGDYRGIKRFDLDLGRIDLEMHKGQAVTSLAMSPDEATLVSGGSDQTVHHWELLSGERVQALKGHSRSPDALAFSPDGRVIASGDRHHFSGDEEQGRAILLWDAATGKVLTKLEGHSADVTALAFSPDARVLITGLQDSTIVVWDVSKFRNLPMPGPRQLGQQGFAGLWDDLAGDATTAQRAVWTLASAPADALAFLRERLKPAPPVDPKHVARWIDDLGSAEFAVRRTATDELKRLDLLAFDAVRKALAGSPPLETARRLQPILDSMTGAPSPELRRVLRSIQALERIGNAEARALLARLAKGAQAARVTKQARLALERLR